MNAEQPLLRVDALRLTYPNGQTALEDVTFELGQGSICGLVGMNGSGKSTLFKTLMGLLRPSAGQVRISGGAVRAALKQNLMSYVPQSEDVDWNFPVLVDDVVMMGRYGHMGLMRRPRAEDRKAVEAALARVGMLDFRKRQIGELSGGQKKRVFLARAIAQGSRIILLDEPFTGVDIKTEEALVALLRELRDQGYLMLVSTHNLGSVPEFCDQVILINRSIVAAGPTQQVFTRDNLALAFGGRLRYVRLEGADLHDDEDPRGLTVLTDDERPLVFYGSHTTQTIVQATEKQGKAAKSGNGSKSGSNKDQGHD